MATCGATHTHTTSSSTGTREQPHNAQAALRILSLTGRPPLFGISGNLLERLRLPKTPNHWTATTSAPVPVSSHTWQLSAGRLRLCATSEQRHAPLPCFRTLPSALHSLGPRSSLKPRSMLYALGLLAPRPTLTSAKILAALSEGAGQRKLSSGRCFGGGASVSPRSS